MTFIAVDDEPMVLDVLMNTLKEAEPSCVAFKFEKAREALNAIEDGLRPDVAFLDIEMSGVNGLELASRIRQLSQNTKIIFVTGHSKYAAEAYSLHARGYLLKPVTAAKVLAELMELKTRPLPTGKRVRIQTFGNFEVFIDNRPLYLPRTKCLECLAYLVDRKGAFIGTGELAAVLWEDKPYGRTVQNNVHRVISDLAKALKAEGIEEILVKARGQIAIDTQKVDCDYFGLLSGDTSQIDMFWGEYMSNYSWAEFTLSGLVRVKNG